MTISLNLAGVVELEKAMIAERVASAVNFLGREVVRFTMYSLIPVLIIVTALALMALCISFGKACFQSQNKIN